LDFQGVYIKKGDSNKKNFDFNEGGIMNKHLSKTLLILVLSLGMVLPMLAQRQTGTIVGTVTDEEGASLPGVGISAKSPALILPEMTTVTNEQGIYRFPSLPSGTYSITYTMDGMNTLVREGIIVTVGQTVSLDVSMQFKTIEENIVVVGESPLIDKQKSSLTTHLDSEFLKAIPAGRDLGSYLFMAPGMIRQEGNEFWMKGTAGLGSNVRENKFNLDGINLNDQTVGTQMVEIGVDIMSEVSVETGGLTAEYGGVTGAVINVISKSGGNDFSGSATFFYRSEGLQSDNTTGTSLEGSGSGYKYIYEPSLTLGGPLKRDKVWFFLGASYIRRAQWIPGFPYDGDAVPNVQAIPYTFGKLSFQPNQENRIVLSYNFTRETNDNFFASPFDSEDTTQNMTNPIHAANIHWTHFFSNSFFMDFRTNYVDWSLNYIPEVVGPRFADLITGLNTGGYGAEILWTQTRYNAKVDGTLFVDNVAGSHEFKGGVEYNTGSIRSQFLPLINPVNGLWLIQTLFGTPYIGIQYLDNDGRLKEQDIHLFIQDTWKVSPRLTLSLGLRLANQRMIIPAQNQDEGSQTLAGVTFNRSVTESFTPIKWTNLDPRVGLIFDITGDGKTLFKASYGRYTAAMLTLVGDYVNPNGYAGAVYILAPDGSPVFPVANIVPQLSKTEFGSHKLAAPYTDEITLALERDITENWSAGIRYTRKMGRNIVWSIDGNQIDMGNLMDNGQLNWTNWVQVPFVDPADGQQKTFWSQKQVLPPDGYLLNPPGANRDFDSVEFKLTKRYSNGWSLLASYVWAKARGLFDTGYWDSDPGGQQYFRDPNAHENALGRVEMDRRHQFKFQGLVQGPLGINVSGFIRYLSGNRYTATINSVHLGIPVLQGTAEIFAEERGSRGYPARFTVDLRLEKIFRADKVTFGIFADAFNLFNSGKALAANVSSSNPVLVFEEMLQIQNPRTLRLGARISF